MPLTPLIRVITLLLIPAGAWAGLDETAYRPYENKTVTAIAISGNKVTKDYIITRELELQPGRPFRLETLKADIQRLDNLMIFSSIKVTPADSLGGVSLEYTVRELPWMIPHVRLGYTEENGWSGGPALSALNMFGRDINISGFVTFGGQNTYLLRIINPWFRGHHISFDFTAAHLSRDNKFNNFEETSDEITLMVGRYLAETGRARLIVSYFGVKSDTDGHTLDADNRDDFFRFGGAFGLDTRDSYINPRRGWLNELKVLGTVGSGAFITGDLDLQLHLPVSGRQTLYLSGLTTLQEGTAREDIPEYMLYYLGGANTIRGYDVDELPLRLFGKNQMIFTAEYQFTVIRVREYNIFKWAVNAGLELAVFTDTGIAWDESEDLSSRRAKTGFGLGLRPLLPGVGEARLDVGFNRSGDFEIHLGVFPKPVAQRFRLR